MAGNDVQNRAHLGQLPRTVFSSAHMGRLYQPSVEGGIYVTTGLTFTNAANLNAIGELTATANLAFAAPSVDLIKPPDDVAATASLSFTVDSVLTGAGQMECVASQLIFSTSVQLGALAGMTATALMAFGSAADLITVPDNNGTWLSNEGADTASFRESAPGSISFGGSQAPLQVEAQFNISEAPDTAKFRGTVDWADDDDEMLLLNMVA